jgi:hypothetical protein
VVYRGTAFPRLRGKLLFAGNSSPTVWTLTLTANGDTVVPNSFATFFTYSTGFADVEVGPDGFIYLANGPYSSNRLLRLKPVPPVFTSSPPLAATQGVLYTYAPTFNGTPPGLHLVSGPLGMAVDSVTWALTWVPTNAQALERTHSIRVRAENGAGFAEQAFTVVVANINDPPGPFGLVSPPNDTTLTFVGSDPSVRFVWSPSPDPDLDTVRYTLQTDTVHLFNSGALRDTLVGTVTSKLLTFPRRTAVYYWRVRASDGQLVTISFEYRRVNVAFTTPVEERVESGEESMLEQNFPNPFNPATTIAFDLARPAAVRIGIYDVSGRLVRTLVDGKIAAGRHEIAWNGENNAGIGVPSGLYFYRMSTSEGFTATRKMILLR